VWSRDLEPKDLFLGTALLRCQLPCWPCGSPKISGLWRDVVDIWAILWYVVSCPSWVARGMTAAGVWKLWPWWGVGHPNRQPRHSNPAGNSGILFLGPCLGYLLLLQGCSCLLIFFFSERVLSYFPLVL
jgi:hypothetical protein